MVDLKIKVASKDLNDNIFFLKDAHGIKSKKIPKKLLKSLIDVKKENSKQIFEFIKENPRRKTSSQNNGEIQNARFECFPQKNKYYERSIFGLTRSRTWKF